MAYSEVRKTPAEEDRFPYRVQRVLPLSSCILCPTKVSVTVTFWKNTKCRRRPVETNRRHGPVGENFPGHQRTFMVLVYSTFGNSDTFWELLNLLQCGSSFHLLRCHTVFVCVYYCSILEEQTKLIKSIKFYDCRNTSFVLSGFTVYFKVIARFQGPGGRGSRDIITVSGPGAIAPEAIAPGPDTEMMMLRLLFVLAETTISPTLYTHGVPPTRD